ncbi:hypothetical protein ACIPW9_31460 [Streptomyces sp. NPDC090052]|uniref:hypothetical protein n=1 Tax=Streptomyces sp. NPDC090052 TaxID=3365931 RepID=UPI0037FF6E7C
MSLFSRRYGAHPVHLLVMACCFTVAGYAAVQLLMGRTVAVAVWFIGAALLHDLVLVPLYSAADLTAQAALPPHKGRPGHTDSKGRQGCTDSEGHRGRTGRSAGRRGLNHLRTPVVLSLLLLLVWFPLILRRSAPYHQDTGLSDSVYLDRWLLITAGLFVASALTALVNTARRRHRARPTADG